jgi:polysaccharide pyruvyl transferase WcaK-like protein
MAKGCTVVALGPMAFAKPQSWPTPDRALYDRYMHEMALLAAMLLERQYFLVIIWSARIDRGSAVQDLLDLMDPDTKKRFAEQMYLPVIVTWKDLVALLLDVDFLIATRLHSLILGFVAQAPAIAISFDPKVDWVMQDLGQADYLFPIRDFKAEEVVEGIEHLEINGNVVKEEIRTYQQETRSVSARQYDKLAELARTTRPTRH